jgi:type I restriction enzyme S subunit
VRKPVSSVALGDVAELNPKINETIQPETQVSFVPMAAVTEVTGEITVEEIRQYADVVKGFTPFKSDDIIVAKITPCFQNGKIAYAKLSRPYGFGSTEFHVIRADTKRLLPRYVFHFLRQDYIRIAGERRMTGSAGQRRVPLDYLASLELPLPPLSEQKRIAEILDGAEALRSKRRAALALLDELTQSIFLDMFGDPSERIVSGGIEFGSVVEEFRYGTSNKSGSNGFLTLRIPNVIGASIELTDLKLVQVDDAEFSRLRLLHGDLLFVRTNGNPDNVGRCAVFEENLIADSGCDPKEFIYASYLIRARLKSSVMPVFIRELMLTFEGRKNLRAAAKTSAGQYNINTQGLGSLPIFVPPIDLQRIFVDRVQVVNGLKAVLEKSQSELDQLFASLQHRAFRGEL